jgi:oligosaccharyltransferase complex subunit epsilon
MSANKNVLSVAANLYNEYKSSTPTKLKLVDAYMFGILLTGITQFVYCCLVGTFPFNAFLAGFISTVASFVLAGK